MMRWLVAILYFLISQNALAQFGNPSSQNAASGFDSTGVGRDSSRIQFAGLEISESSQTILKKKEFKLDRVQFYLPVFNRQYVNSSLGNNGSAQLDLNFNPQFSAGFDWGFHAYDAYMLELSQTKFYDAQSPYTEASYVQGSKQEAFFNLQHTQNVGRKLNFGLEFKRVNSEGYYQRQTAQHSALRFHAWYRPGKERYQAFFALTYHKGTAYENGGLTAIGDSLFQDGTENNRQLYPVWLSEASTNLFRNGLLIRHFYDIQKPKVDTNGIVESGRTIRAQLTHSYQFKKQSYIDFNPDSSFYSSNPLLIDQTNVNYTNRIIENEIALLSLRQINDTSQTTGWDLKGFIKQQLFDVSSNLTLPGWTPYTLQSNNLSFGGFFKINFKEWLALNIHSEAFFAGFNSGDIQLNAELKSQPSTNILVRTGFESFRKEADYQYQLFISNFSAWTLNTEKINQLKFYGNIELQKQKLQFELANRVIGNWVVLNQSKIPEQTNQAINILSATLHHRIDIKKWSLVSRILVQNTSGPELIRLPLIQYQESIFREGRIVKKTPYRFGVDIIGCSSFRANAYMPQSGLFYLQDTKKNTGLMQANIYISAKIKRARVFVMLEHLNAGIQNERADLIPFYPLPDRLLKIGLNWVFFD
jgi:hypothetical protein